MKISITEKHIEQGERRSCFRCPVALALLEQVKGAAAVAVGTTWISARSDNGQLIMFSDQSFALSDFIETFDNGGKVEPFTFEIEVKK